MLLDELENAGFWKLAPADDVLGADGSQLVIETVRNGKYSVLTRWTPDCDQEARGLTKLNKIVSRLLANVDAGKAD
jgi:hypothetical protein